MKRYRNRIGEAYGRLTVMEFAGIDNDTSKQYSKRIKWKCICECGTKQYITTAGHLSQGTKSCGCLSKEVRSKMSEKRTLSKKEAGIRRVYSIYKKEAKDRKLEFSLDIEDFSNLIFSNCLYCNSLPQNIVKIRRPKIGDFTIKCGGIDRKNNSIGYTKENSVPCCKICNLSKRNLNYEQFIHHIFTIYNNLKK